MDWQQTMDSFLLELRSSLPTLSDGSVLLDNVISFFRSIDWTEPWIITLLSSEVVLFLITLMFRRNLQIQTALFVLISGFIYKAEFLNSICAQHWVKFSRQMYFDRNGIFWSSLISGPLLFILFCILVNYLLELTRLMIQSKKTQLIAQSRKQKTTKKKN